MYNLRRSKTTVQDKRLRENIVMTKQSVMVARCCVCWQAVIDANIIPALIDVMGRAEFKTRKEAAWAITNAVSGGSADQIRFLVDQGCIPPLCNLLTVMDGKIVQVALNGLEHILRAGLQESKLHGRVNLYAVAIEECYGTEP